MQDYYSYKIYFDCDNYPRYFMWNYSQTLVYLYLWSWEHVN